MPIDPAAEQAIRARLASSEFVRWMGTEIVSIDDGACEMRLPIQAHHRNPSGIVHGGVIASILDGAIGLALRSRRGPGSRHVTVHLDVQYLSMATGSALHARAELVHAGSRSAYGEASCLDDEGTLVAKASATFLIL